MFGQQRDPLCEAHILKANNYFAFLICGVKGFICVVNLCVYLWAKCTRDGLSAQYIIEKNLLVYILL